jgi:8-oxo-dGTP pyrophosphatase MutT (NUDIX family)
MMIPHKQISKDAHAHREREQREREQREREQRERAKRKREREGGRGHHKLMVAGAGCPTWGFALVVTRHPQTGQYLAVEENKGRGWWLPGGFVEYMDSYEETARKETKEEAGMDVELRGVLRLEHSLSLSGARQRVIFYAEPVDPLQPPKSVPDEESLSAKWLSLDEIRAKQALMPPVGMRGPELHLWARYIEQGGPIYPLSILSNKENSSSDPTVDPLVIPRGAALTLKDVAP